jgi:hypothetical protein
MRFLRGGVQDTWEGGDGVPNDWSVARVSHVTRRRLTPARIILRRRDLPIMIMMCSASDLFVRQNYVELVLEALLPATLLSAVRQEGTNHGRRSN